MSAPLVLALVLANARAQFARLNAEWNALGRADDYDALADVARKLRACGQRVEKLERQAFGPAVPEYGAESGVVT